MIHLRAFRAIDEKENCYRYATGHQRVLEGFNLANISTNNVSWADNPNVYVVMALDSKTDDVLGGIRIQIADGRVPLPVEDAVSHFDPKVHEMVEHYALNGGTSELCGLWNSRSLAPNAGITLNLVVAGMALCNQLPITSIFTIVASYTLKIARRMGFQIETELGNNGEFVYPNSNYIARVLSMNPLTLEHTYNIFRDQINELRENPFLEKTVEIPSGDNIVYSHDLVISNVGKIIYEI
ncbi:MAG TPA: hypothetical protein VJ911_06575 [Cryomorphaceae bacterium]|nr:hypothetical protein [Cryomorphaceae bacterium]